MNNSVLNFRQKKIIQSLNYSNTFYIGLYQREEKKTDGK